MAITITLPANSSYTVTTIGDIIDFVAIDAVVDDFSATQFSGSGTFDGAPASFTITGSGFLLGPIGGSIAVVSGIVDTVTFTSGGETVPITNVAIIMDFFASIISAEELGINIFGIENFLMNREWDVTLGNADDIAPKGTLFGDGVPLNLRGNDILRGRGGDDDLFSGDGDDTMFGGTGADMLNGGKGRDTLNGGIGKDILRGESGADNLSGQNGNDRLFGGGGRDVLDGGKGRDLLVGGGGSDRFIFADNYGNDRIKGFDANDNKEKIDLSAVTAITGFTDLKNNDMTQIGNDVVIDDGAGTTITLLGVDIADLGKADFIF